MDYPPTFTAASRVPLTQSPDQMPTFNTGPQAFELIEPIRMDVKNLIFNPDAPKPMSPTAFDFFKNSPTDKAGGLFGSTQRY